MMLKGMRDMSFNKGSRDFLVEIKTVFLLLMTLSLPFSESLKTICLLTSTLVFIVQIIRGDTDIKPTLIHYGFILLLLSSLISSIFADEPSRSLGGSKDILFYTTVFFIASTVNDSKKKQAILWGLYISTALSALSGMINSTTTHRPLEIHALGNQNYTAMFFIIVLISMISAILFSDREKPTQKLVLLSFSILILIASAMTLMRASFLGLFAFFLSLIRFRKPSRTVLIFVLVFFILTILILYIDRGMWQKLFSFKSMVSRLDIWKGAIGLFLKNPLTGVGLNHFEFKFPEAHPVEPNNTVYDAHSLYLQVAAQMGLLGLFSMILIFIGFIRELLNLKNPTGFSKYLSSSALGAFLVITITGIFDTTFHHEHAMAFTLISGLAFGHIKRTADGL